MSRQKVYGTSSDYSEGLMGEIQRLIAPPNEEYKKKPQNPFKRAGKNNHDFCDACQEPGNLICCDYCAASFHLSCHDPPLEEEDIPSGLWLCHTCTMKEKYSKQEVVEEKEAISTSEELKKEPEAIETVAEVYEAVKSESSSTDEQRSPFMELVHAASLLNPKQFELPIEMKEQFPFPGSERIEPMKNGRRVKTKRLVELDAHGCVPTPFKMCFTCNKTCRKAPLIACDYCPLFFHQDCLEPPMTHLPGSRFWMCPNHFQNFVDMNLISSLSASERLKYWDQFGKDSIDHEVIKLQFFRKVHMANPPFRTKAKPQTLDDIEIPEIVRYHYENPPNLLPSLKTVMRIESLKKRGTVSLEPAKRTHLCEVDEQLGAMESARKKLKTIFSDQEDIYGLIEESEKEEEADEIEKTSKSPKKSKKKAEIIEIVKEEEEREVQEESKETVNIEIEIKEEIVADDKKSILTPQEFQSINEQLQNLNVEAIKLLAFQRLQQIVNENPNCIQKFQDKATASETVVEIAKWDIQRFPIPMPNDVKSEIVEKSIRIHDRPFHIRSDAEKASSVALSLEYPIHRSKVQSRAVLTFANDYLTGRIWYTIAPNLNQSVAMRYRSFDIGVGADNHLDLSRFGICASASPKHAVIFYDDITKQFELMNYSEFGSEVNGQLYSCDFTEHPPEECETTSSPLKEKRVAIQSKIKNMLDAKKKIREGIDKAENEGDDAVMAAEESAICNCKGRHPMIAAWEGTALLQHGFLLKFGCLSFVFSIVDSHVEIEP